MDGPIYVNVIVYCMHGFTLTRTKMDKYLWTLVAYPSNQRKSVPQNRLSPSP